MRLPSSVRHLLDAALGLTSAIEVRCVAAVMSRSMAPQWIAVGTDLRLFYNEAFIEILGDKHPAYGIPMRQVWPELWNSIEPLIAKTLGGEAYFFDNARFDLMRGGRLVQAWFTFAYTPLKDDHGNVVGMHCQANETTTAVLGEQARLERAMRLQELWRQAPGFVAITRGPDHVYELCNDAYVALVGNRPLIGLSVREALPELDARFIELLDQVLASGEPFVGRGMSVTLERSGGVLESRVVDFVFQPIREADGSIERIFVQGYDLTGQHEAEAAAETERRRLSTLLDAIPIGIAFADPRGNLRTTNPALREIWGPCPASQSVEEYAQWKGWWPPGSPRAGQRLQAHEWPMARALAGERVDGELIEIEPFRGPEERGEGSEREERKTLLLHSAPVLGPDGGIWGAVTAQQDVTDRVRTERASRESELLFRTMADAMPQMVWSARPDGHHDFFNAQWYDFTGMDPGSTDGDGWTEVFHPDDVPRASDLWRHSVTTGEPYEIEYRLRHRSGNYRWVLGRALPVREDAEIQRWMGTCTDIHVHKLAQSALVESEARFRALADHIPQLAWMAEPDGSIGWYNDRWFDYTGTTLDDVRGWGWDRVHHPDHLSRVVTKFRSHIVNGEPWEDTFPLKGRDGVYRWFLSRAVPIRDGDGRVVKWFGSNTDVTEQREAESALREADRRKDEFLAMLAHELRNPLAPIVTAAEVMRRPQVAAQVLQDAARIVARQAQHMTELVDDLLDVSRVTRGLITLDDRVLDFREAVRGALEQARPHLEGKRHALSVQLGDQAAWVRGDATRLTQITTNLLNNAAKYTPAGGRIEVSLSLTDKELRLDVRDNGQGMDAELIPHVFELFAQGMRAPDRAQGGLGIGLALVRSLAQLHGGRVEAASEGPGLGSRFSVWLPLGPAPELATTAGATRQTVAHLTLLVVDDNMDAADALLMLLQAEGHRVLLAADGATALAVARSEPVDVYLLDIGLPDMSGHELARTLRANVGGHGVMFALTGYGQTDDVAQSERAGFDRHFVKPISIQTLLDALREVPDLKAARSQP